jgi:glycosyltransferase involved in cell wall biosynthesis
MPIHQKAVPGGVLNTFRVAAFVRRNKIDVIHAHSRRANWVAAQVSALTGRPYVTTIHQLMPVHTFSKLFPCLGDASIAIDEAIGDQLRSEFQVPADRIRLIRNGIDVESYVPSLRPTPNVKQILFVGRLSGGRWPVFQFFLDTLKAVSKRLPPAHYKIVGRLPDERRAPLTRELSMFNSAIAPSRVDMLGHVNDLPTTIRNCDGVIAAGRSALESLAGGRALVMMGEGGLLGLCTPDNWAQALRTNFGDHLPKKDFQAAKLEASLRDLLSPHPREELIRWGRSQVERYFDSRLIAREVEKVYQWLTSRS